MCGDPEIDTSYQDFKIQEARDLRRDERQRNRRIDRGMNRIDAVFDGGRAGGQTFAGTEPLLDAYRTASENYYLPQLDSQIGTAKDDMTFSLARAGLTDSSMAGEAQADLLDAASQQRGSILSRIARDVSGQRTALNQNRLSAEAGLRATGDATAATDAALSSLTTFRATTPELSPLGHLFAGLSQGIGAAQQGYQTGLIRRAATPVPLTTARNVA